MENPIGKIEQPISLPIKRIVRETEHIKTFFFNREFGSKPGQFMIMWIPRVNEKPFSIAYDENGELGLSIAVVGPFTEKLFTFKEGDLVGLRGPYGSWFKLKPEYKKVLMVGGGYGTAPLATLAQQAVAQGTVVDFCRGAHSKNLLLFGKRLNEIGVNKITATHDGSEGTQGSAVNLANDQIDKEQYDCVYICGPELMEKKIVVHCAEKKVLCQVSIERHMKCGFGLCGQCCIDGSGERMCKEGPVTTGEYALKQKEFGAYHRSKSGLLEYFHDDH
ncbi:MAG: dihydroorotate dehydrogenase electron transfer subunit [Patescibacteria group bacterium]